MFDINIDDTHKKIVIESVKIISKYKLSNKRKSVRAICKHWHINHELLGSTCFFFPPIYHLFHRNKFAPNISTLNENNVISGGVPLENDVDMLDLISGKSFIVARHKYEISWLHAFYFGSMFQVLNLKKEKKTITWADRGVVEAFNGVE